MESKECLNACPNCGEYDNTLQDETYSDGQYMTTYTCDNCGITYYEAFNYSYTTWDPDEVVD